MQSSKLKHLPAYRYDETTTRENVLAKLDNRQLLLDAHLSDLPAHMGSVPHVESVQLPENSVTDLDFLKVLALAHQSGYVKWD